MSKVAWIGLGVMGYPMAGHIREKSEHDLVVYNRTEEKAARWAEQYGGETAATPSQAAQDADLSASASNTLADKRYDARHCLEHGRLLGPERPAVWSHPVRKRSRSARLRRLRFSDFDAENGRCRA